MKHFYEMEICYINPKSILEVTENNFQKMRFESTAFEGEWVRGVSAGGCRQHKSKHINKLFFKVFTHFI